MIYAVYGRWDHGKPIPPTDVETISGAFRPDDEGVCVWIEPGEPNMLLISIDAEAASFDGALQHGRDALLEAVSTASLSGTPVEVTWSP